MSVRDELRDPYGWVAAGTLGGVAGVLAGAGALAAGPAIAVGLGVGAAVMGVKAAIGAVTHRGGSHAEPAVPARTASRLPAPPPGSAADQLLRRADAALDELHQLAKTDADPFIAEQVGPVDERAAEAARSLRELAGRVTLLEDGLRNTDVGRLAAERERLARVVGAAPEGPTRDEQQRLLALMDDRLATTRRMLDLRERQLVRMESAVTTLEGLTARTREVLAVGSEAMTPDLSAEMLSGLSGELESLRAGLEQVDAATRGAG